MDERVAAVGRRSPVAVGGSPIGAVFSPRRLRRLSPRPFDDAPPPRFSLLAAFRTDGSRRKREQRAATDAGAGVIKQLGDDDATATRRGAARPPTDTRRDETRDMFS